MKKYDVWIWTQGGDQSLGVNTFISIEAGGPRVAAQKAIHNHPVFGLKYHRKVRLLKPGESLNIRVENNKPGGS